MERSVRTLLVIGFIAMQGCASQSSPDGVVSAPDTTQPEFNNATVTGVTAHAAGAAAAGSEGPRDMVRRFRGEPTAKPAPAVLPPAASAPRLGMAERSIAAPVPASAPMVARPPSAGVSVSEPPVTPAGSAPAMRAALADAELVVGAGGKERYRVVHVFFATDRNTTEDRRLDKRFGTGRSNLKYGTVAVSIPRAHRLGEIERPRLIRMEFRDNPENHMSLLNLAMLDTDQFYALLGRRIKATPGRGSFLFVHGYNVSFADAARRTAQMHYDLNFDGAPIFYSWPSQASTAKYTVDEANIEWSEAHMLHFLTELLARSETESVYLVAHSMGNRGLTNAIATLVERQPESARKIKEIILAAPDIDADVFVRDIAPALARSGAGVTLYASSSDRALIASRTVHGSPRAGDSGRSRVITTGVETIDASAIDTSWLGHSYFAEAHPLIADMFNLVKNRQRAAQRFGLVQETDTAGNYWRFKR